MTQNLCTILDFVQIFQNIPKIWQEQFLCLIKAQFDNLRYWCERILPALIVAQ